MQMKWYLKVILIDSQLLIAYGIFYLRDEGIHLLSPCLFTSENVRSPLYCVALCAQHSACKAVSYHAVHKTCCLGGDAFDENAVYAKDDNSSFFREIQDHVWYGDWLLAFRAVAGTGQSVYSAWTDSGHHDDGPGASIDRLQWGCLTMDGSLPCQQHFRSQYLDTWENVSKVKLCLYKNSTKVVDVVFNGTGSTLTSWMQPSRILQSPWSDLSLNSSAYNYFGVETDHRRYFFINRNYGGCQNDWGWLCVVDPLEGIRTPCGWENLPHPAFVYSPLSTGVLWQGPDIGVADVMAVFIQF